MRCMAASVAQRERALRSARSRRRTHRKSREAVRIGNEVETLYTNGPAGGGGVTKSAREVVAVASVLMPRELADPQFRFVEA